MGLRRILQLAAFLLFMASLGLTMHKCAGVAFAFEGAAPVAVSNGDVSLSCSDNNRLLGKATGSVACLDDIPDDVSQNSVLFGPYSSFFGLDNSPAIMVTVGVTTYISRGSNDPDLIMGIVQAVGSNLYLITQGNATASKHTDNAITAGARLKLDTRGYSDIPYPGTSGDAGNYTACQGIWFYGSMLRYCSNVTTANDNERAIGIAASSAALGGSTVEMIVGVGVAPTAITGTGDISVSSSNVISFTGSAGVAQNAIRHVAFLQQLSTVTGTADHYLPAIGTGESLSGSGLSDQLLTSFPSGAVVDGIVCNCEATPASGKTVTFRLCKKSGLNNCHTGGSDGISECSITDSTTTCTDTTFLGSVSLSTNNQLYYYVERDGGTPCKFYSCRFPYTQSEY